MTSYTDSASDGHKTRCVTPLPHADCPRRRQPAQTKFHQHGHASARGNISAVCIVKSG
eukprot:CAMPEP_0195059368 /NCGR_PEP_ID=MMETSP0448-20130528/6876_1 /TAXON_ID=66468 /ORGANISM="Heterocapsa triquestra, Strain CCMP 448" /LENGTH=57 /DNA_ID=CAMNT_0040089629 /DNA_START=53 /DNA_END=222 /DNA_ORIENTATION=+